MKFMHLRNTCAVATLLTLLAACGGGGGSTDNAATSSTLSFSLKDAYASRVAAGSTDSFTVSGTCTGTITIALAKAVAATFEGVPGYAQQTSTTGSTNCPGGGSGQTGTTGTNFYDGAYTLIGSSIPNREYATFAALPVVLPATAKVGDAADIVTLTRYPSSAKGTPVGRRVVSYAVTADTASTASLALITKTYNAQDQLEVTEQSNYRLAADGSLTLLSIFVVSVNGTQQIFTKT